MLVDEQIIEATDCHDEAIASKNTHAFEGHMIEAIPRDIPSRRPGPSASLTSVRSDSKEKRAPRGVNFFHAVYHRSKQKSFK